MAMNVIVNFKMRILQGCLSILLAASLFEKSSADSNDDIADYDLDALESFNAGGLEWRIRYNDDMTSDHFVSEAQATGVGGFLEGLIDRQTADMGFGNYYSTTTDDGYFDILLFNFDVLDPDHWRQGILGYYCTYEFGLNGASLATPPNTTDRKVTAHELFHSIQGGYRNRGGSSGSNYGRVVSEGHARAMDDRWEVDFDLTRSTNGLYLPGASQIFLDDYADFDFWKIGTDEDTHRDYPYSAGMFWSYLCEQLGNEINDLGNGYDWILRFYEIEEERLLAGEDVDQEILTNEAIKWFSRGRNENFESMYFDFAICNYARDYDQGALPDEVRYRSSNLVPRYLYRDEQEADASGFQQNYGSLGSKVQKITSPTGGSFADQAIAPNSARYYEWDLTGGLNAVECEIIGVRCTTDKTANICVMGITENGRIVDLQKASGTTAARSYIVSAATPTNDRIAKIAVVVVGDSQGVGDLDLWFDRGEAILKVSHPSQSNPAYPGLHDDPETFLVRAIVEGPGDLIPPGFGNLSVQGLLQSDFEVLVNSQPATIRASSYVGGEYWLTVEAPNQAADGIYTLETSLCRGSKVVRKPLSVIYGDYLFRHVICLDVSGSMNFPASKIAAAKQAALFYVDTIRNDHPMGLVSFSGDANEPNIDAIAAGGQMFAANGASRLLFKVGINNYTPGGGTSIGDGLTVSQDLIDADPTAGELIDSILLLSDGAQNEDSLWDGGAVTERFVGGPGILGNDTIINTLSFGPNADTNLMQDIASTTDGEHSYIEVSTGALKSRSNTGSMFLNLATAYLAGTEKAQQLERLACINDSIRAGESAAIQLELSDAKVEDGMIYIYWDGEPGALKAQIFGPDGQRITAPDATIFPNGFANKERHTVWQMKTLLPNGRYTIRVENESGLATPFFAGISGRPINRVKCQLAFSSYLRSNMTFRSGGPLQKFEIGQPVTIRAFLNDRDGTITRDAHLDMEITLPTGELACGPVRMYDDGSHDDGAAGDGVYGAIFRQTLWGQNRGTDSDKGDLDAPFEANGVYRVNLIASGIANDGSRFQRHLNGSFTVYDEGPQAEGFDEDRDGLPNAWENSQGTNPKIADQDEDPDEDGLTNMEEYLQGTLALNGDSDGGGEADGSEVSKGNCPLDSEDDSIRSSNQISVLVSNLESSCVEGTCHEGCQKKHDIPVIPETNLIQLPLIRSWEAMELQRTKNPNGPVSPGLSVWNTIATVQVAALNNQIYEDSGLAPETRYYYRLRGRNPSTGAFTAWSAPTWGTPIANRPPAAIADRLVVAVDQIIEGQLVASDPDDNSVISFSLDNPVAGLTVSADGSYIFDATDPAYDGIEPWESIELIANWSVTDNSGASSSSALTITVSAAPLGLVTDSASDFSGSQGRNGWYYGYRNYTLDGGGADYDPVRDFVPFRPAEWRGSQWRLAPTEAPWTLIGRLSTHPNGTNSSPNQEHWTLRRWIPRDLKETTPVAITWHVRKQNKNSDGVTGSLHVNGRMVDSRLVPGNDSIGEFRTYYLNLEPGDIIDLAVSPVGRTNRGDGSDSSVSRFWISKSIPENPLQPDGTPFSPLQAIAYDSWTENFGLEGITASPDADPAGDGISNLLKYAFNMNPNIPYQGSGRFLDTDEGSSGLPAIIVRNEGNGPRAELSFVSRRNAPNLRYQVESSVNLAEWQGTTTIPRVTIINQDWSKVTIQHSVNAPNEPARFLRVRVEIAE